jgi:hypothetical protein
MRATCGDTHSRLPTGKGVASPIGLAWMRLGSVTGRVLNVEMAAIDGTLRLLLTASKSKGWLTTCIAVRCPHCDREEIVKRGKTHGGTQRYLC